MENNKLARGRKYDDEQLKQVGRVGKLSPEMERRWPIWRVVLAEGGPSIAELKTPGAWDLRLLYEYNALLDMKEDSRVAMECYSRDEVNKPARK